MQDDRRWGSWGLLFRESFHGCVKHINASFHFKGVAPFTVAISQLSFQVLTERAGFCFLAMNREQRVRSFLELWFVSYLTLKIISFDFPWVVVVWECIVERYDTTSHRQHRVLNFKVAIFMVLLQLMCSMGLLYSFCSPSIWNLDIRWLQPSSYIY